MSSDANPLGLTIIDDVTDFVPAHEVTDQAKADKLAADMEVRGWQGAPLVVIADEARAITGVHRLAAATAADIPAPGVDLEALLAAVGVDLWERLGEEDLAELDQDDAIIRVIDDLDETIRTAYGLDLH